jgi:hypothetical protein
MYYQFQPLLVEMFMVYIPKDYRMQRKTSKSRPNILLSDFHLLQIIGPVNGQMYVTQASQFIILVKIGSCIIIYWP